MAGPKAKTPYERVLRKSHPNPSRMFRGSPCLECDLKGPGPYPSVGLAGGGMILAARAVFEHWRGAIPDDAIVCRDCFNPKCCNIAHLSLGTHAVKAKQLIEAGRTNRGNSKLDGAEVAAIREMVAAGITDAEISRRIGIGRGAVANIRIGKSWHASCTNDISVTKRSDRRATT